MSAQLSQPPADAHIAPCGLFCTNCRKFKVGKCKGCQIEPGFKACSIRKCCAEKGITLCARCPDFAAPRDFNECRKINNFIAKIFKLIFKSDRPAALAMIRDEGTEGFIADRTASGKM